MTRYRISRRLHVIGSRTTREPDKKKLSDVLEGALVRYIRAVDKIRLSVRLDQLSNMAHAILKQDYLEDGSLPTVDLHWPQRFLGRHAEFRQVKQKPLELERKLCS